MAAGLGFKDFQTGEVLTAADVDGYLMQGIWVFADATARNAAVTSPQEGNACYLKDTNQVLTYSGSAWVAVGGGSPLTTKGDLYGFSTVDARIPIGANDTVLTADSTQSLGLKWAAPSSGGMTLISTTTLSGASVTLSSIPATYNNLQLVIRNYKPATDNTLLRLRINSDSGTRYKVLFTDNTANAGTTETFNNSSIAICGNNDDTVATGLSIVNIYDYTNAVTWKMLDLTSIAVDPTTVTEFKPLNGVGFFNQTGAISSLDLFPTSGNFTSGTALLYGVK
jgi:hypothetical protein